MTRPSGGLRPRVREPSAGTYDLLPRRTVDRRRSPTRERPGRPLAIDRATGPCVGRARSTATSARRPSPATSSTSARTAAAHRRARRATGGELWRVEIDGASQCCIGVARGLVFVGTPPAPSTRSAATARRSAKATVGAAAAPGRAPTRRRRRRRRRRSPRASCGRASGARTSSPGASRRRRTDALGRRGPEGPVRDLRPDGT